MPSAVRRRTSSSRGVSSRSWSPLRRRISWATAACTSVPRVVRPLAAATSASQISSPLESLDRYPEAPLAECAVHDVAVVVGGDEHHANVEALALERLQDLDPAEAGHLHVEHADVGGHAANLLERSRTVLRLPNELQLGTALHRVRQPAAVERMVIGDHHPDPVVRHGAVLPPTPQAPLHQGVPATGGGRSEEGAPARSGRSADGRARRRVRCCQLMAIPLNATGARALIGVDGAVWSANNAFCSLVRLEEPALRRVGLRELVHSADRRYVAAHLVEVLAGGDDLREFDARLRPRTGTTCPPAFA